MGLWFGGALRHEGVPGHMRQTVRTRQVVGGLKERAAIWRVVGDGSFAVGEMPVHCCCRLVLEVCHQHGGSFKVEHTIAACLYLLQRSWIDANRRLGRRGR